MCIYVLNEANFKIMEFREILKRSKIKPKDFAMKIGVTYGSYRNLINKGTPKWIKAFEFGYKLGKESKDV